MQLIVPQKMVPDLVEELEVSPDSTDIDREFLEFVLNEWDAQALEEALLVKEATGAQVTAVGLGDAGIDQALYTALAKGADRAVKLGAPLEGWVDSHRRAAALSAWIATQPCDLVLAGVQAPDDLDGQLPALLAARLGWPYVSVVVGVEVKERTVRVTQEYGGGRAAELDVPLPAVLGIQAARQPPRYAPIARVRQAMQSGALEEVPAELPEVGSGLGVRRLYAPERGGRAEMLTGTAAEVAERIVELLRSKGLVP